MDTLGAQSIRLLRTHPRILAYVAKLPWHTTSNIREATIDYCTEIQAVVVGVTRTMVLMAVFGAAVPPLLVLAPVFIWLQGCASSWLFQAGPPDPTDLQLGKGSHLTAFRVASRVLVQQPNELVIVHCLSWLINGFVMYDLEFNTGEFNLLHHL